MILMWIIWTAIFTLLILSGIFAENSVILFTAAAFVLLTLLSVIINRIAGHRISVTFSFPDNVQKNTDLSGTVNLYNNSKFISYGASELYIKIQNMLTGEAVSFKIKLPLAANEISSAYLCLKSRNCGMISVSVEKLRLYDYTGLTFKTVSPDFQCKIPVLPDLTDTKKRIEIINASYGFHEDYKSYSPYLSGDDMSEVFGLCDYSEGDSLKSINYKLSAKHNRLIVKKGSLPAENSLLIIFDNIISDKLVNSPDLISLAAEIFISLSQDLTEKNITYNALWASENGSFHESEKIENDDDAAVLVNRILSAGFVKSDASISELVNFDEMNYSAVIMVTAGRENLSLNNEAFTIINVNAYYKNGEERER